MRVLCTCIPAYGHFYPMVPLSRALADEGHDVAFATAKRFHPRVAGAGFTPLPAGLAMAELLDGAQRRLGSLLRPER
jgi:UDP:flavonoid glycosyltransferase YjiC (YdhE family)